MFKYIKKIVNFFKSESNDLNNPNLPLQQLNKLFKYQNKKIQTLEKNNLKKDKKIKNLIEKHKDEIGNLIGKHSNEIDVVLNKLAKDEDDKINNPLSNDAFDKKLRTFVFNNPKIKKSPHSTKLNPGEHSSSHWVEKIGSQIKNDKIISKYIVTIASCEYSHSKERKIIIKKRINNTKNKNKFPYYAEINDIKGDKRYAMRLTLSTMNLYDAVLIIKYLIHRVNFFKKYKIVINK